jgi:inner membrane transporter RhtA
MASFSYFRCLYFTFYITPSYHAPVRDVVRDVVRSPMREEASGSAPSRLLDRLPPQSFFLVSAVFHYLGPSLAVLLFAQVDVLGVAWLRIASAAAVFAVWRRPWRRASRLDRESLLVLAALGAVLAAMNILFYLAVARLPLSTVGAIEFLGTVLIAAAGTRTRRNAAALALTTAGVVTITQIRITGQPLGFVFAFGNCALFMLYVILGHRIANSAGQGQGEHGREEAPRSQMSGIDRLGVSMLIAAVCAAPIGLRGALPTLAHPVLLLAGIGVGICSSVIPYVTDQLAMARLPRATFALMLALLPMFATLIGAAVLGQVPTGQDMAGIAMVITGVALHKASPPKQPADSCGGAEQQLLRRKENPCVMSDSARQA